MLDSKCRSLADEAWGSGTRAGWMWKVAHGVGNALVEAQIGDSGGVCGLVARDSWSLRLGGMAADEGELVVKTSSRTICQWVISKPGYICCAWSKRITGASESNIPLPGSHAQLLSREHTWGNHKQLHSPQAQNTGKNPTTTYSNEVIKKITPYICQGVDCSINCNVMQWIHSGNTEEPVLI